MRRFFVVGLLMVPLSAFAAEGDVTVTVTAQEQSIWGQVSGVMDRCVADAALRSQASACRDLAAFLDAWATKIKDAKPVEVQK